MNETDLTNVTIKANIVNRKIEFLNDQIIVLLLDNYPDAKKIATLFQQQFECYSEMRNFLLEANSDAQFLEKFDSLLFERLLGVTIWLKGIKFK